MIALLDAYAAIAFLAGERAGELVRARMRSQDADVWISAVNLAEVSDRLRRRVGLDSATTEERLDLLLDAGVQVHDPSGSTARSAGSLRARYYQRRQPISLADAFALATALQLDASLLTADAALLTVAEAERVRVVPLLDQPR